MEEEAWRKRAKALEQLIADNEHALRSSQDSPQEEKELKQRIALLLLCLIILYSEHRKLLKKQ